MEIVGFLAPWLLIGIGVFFVAFSGGPGAAREAYLTRGRRAFGITRWSTNGLRISGLVGNTSV